IHGIDAGTISLRKIMARLALKERNRLSRSGSTSLAAAQAEIIATANVEITASQTLDTMPEPNQMMMSGPSAIFGTLLSRMENCSATSDTRGQNQSIRPSAM